MPFEPVRIGIIGCDGYPQELIKRLCTIPDDGVITAAVSPDPGTPGAEGCRRSGVPVYTSVDAMLDAGGFEVVINATPIHLHADFSRKCLEAGYSVWMEKPPTATIQELDALSAVAAAHDRRVAVCFNWLYSHLLRELKDELVSGHYGALRRVRSIGAWVRGEDYFTRNNWSGQLRLGDAWVLDGSINNPFAHVVCNGLYFAGPEVAALAGPVRVDAELYHANAIDSEDTSCLRVTTRDGIEVLSHLTLAPEQEIPPTTVMDTDEACIRLVDFERVEIAWRDGRQETRESGRENRIEMLQHLCHAFRSDEPYRCDLAMCRPFTLTVNAAFDAAGEVWAIPGAELQRRPWNDTRAWAVRGINRYLERAHAEGALFSEIEVPWARPGVSQPVADYRAFPTRFMADAASPSGP